MLFLETHIQFCPQIPVLFCSRTMDNLLRTAVTRGDANEVRIVLRMLMEFNIDRVDTIIDIDGLPLLHYACSNNHISVARVLISEFKASLYHVTNGHTPLECACINGHTQIWLRC